MAKDLLSEAQSQVFIDMVRDIVRQVKQNPKQKPIAAIPHKYRQVSWYIGVKLNRLVFG